MARHVLERQPGHRPALRPRDRVGGFAEVAALAGFHFDEHQRATIARDDVQFAAAPAVAARNNCVPATLELATGEIFAAFSEQNPGARHGA